MKTALLLFAGLTGSAAACEAQDILVTTAHVPAQALAALKAQKAATASSSKRPAPAKPATPPQKRAPEKESRPARLSYLLM